jgi:DNA-binding YbaB/EbfC family protein
MFDQLKNLSNLPGLLAKAQQMQEKMQQVQADLARKQVSAEAAGGAVTAIVNGKLELIKVRMDKTKLDLNDTELLEDLITAAVNAAQSKAAELVRQEMAKVSADLGLPPGMIPGM